MAIQSLTSIYSYPQPLQSCKVDHVLLCAVFTLGFLVFCVHVNLLVINSSSLDPTVHFCPRNITIIPNIDSPDYMLVSESNPKLTSFAKAVL